MSSFKPQCHSGDDCNAKESHERTEQELLKEQPMRGRWWLSSSGGGEGIFTEGCVWTRAYTATFVCWIKCIWIYMCVCVCVWGVSACKCAYERMWLGCLAGRRLWVQPVTAQPWLLCTIHQSVTSLTAANKYTATDPHSHLGAHHTHTHCKYTLYHPHPPETRTHSFRHPQQPDAAPKRSSSSNTS